MLTHAFEVWRVHRVSLMTDARNVRSRNAILRLGAKFDGILRAARVAVDGRIRDTAAFSIVEAGWPEVKAGLQAHVRERGPPQNTDAPRAKSNNRDHARRWLRSPHYQSG